MSTDVRARLTPHMLEYDAQFSDSGEIRWLPYVMYFHPAGYRSAVVSTDSLGFRYATTREGEPLGVDDSRSRAAVNVLAGSSTVFGIGASSDAATLASRLNHHQEAQAPPWVNFGGRSHNSTQEAILFALTRHRLPAIERIVLLSGFNDLGLARLPVARHLESGAFFLCNTFFERLSSDPTPRRRWVARGRTGRDGRPLELDEQVELAADLVLRHLDVWQALADHAGASLTFVLQPLAGWVRARGADEEEALFARLDELGGFSQTYGDILQPEVHQRYAERLRKGCEQTGTPFVDLTSLLAEALAPTEWVFVDRIHFTDHGYDLVARILLDHVIG